MLRNLQNENKNQKSCVNDNLMESIHEEPRSPLVDFNDRSVDKPE